MRLSSILEPYSN